MLDILLDTLIDLAKLLPFLFFTFLLLEFIEHKFSKKAILRLEKSGKFGPIVGGILGGFPQCGFSVAITNLYVTKIVSMGTLIAVYLSTSDEMLSILIARGESIWIILRFIGIKILIGIFAGFLIDLFLRRKKSINNNIHSFCDNENCHCDHHQGILLSTLKHVLNIGLFIGITSFIINIILSSFSEDAIKGFFIQNSILAPFIASLVGLIPNCAASVVVTELYITDVITFGTALAGLLTSSGVALLVLFRVNRNLKENLLILTLIYGIGVISGIIFNVLGV